jgi:hypothetical protein
MRRAAGRLRFWRGWCGPGIAFGAIRLALDASHEVEAAARKHAAVAP